MSILYYIVVAIYTLALIYITLYCLFQFHLLYAYKRYYWKNKEGVLPETFEEEELPFVTVQLPIFNEMYVVERLIDNITKFDYPKDRFEIHIWTTQRMKPWKSLDEK